MKVLLLTTSFPLTKTSVSGVFIKKLTDHLALTNTVTVLTPSEQNQSAEPINESYPIETFSYAPQRWSLLAHQAGGIPATLKAKPLSIFLVPVFIASMTLKTLQMARSYEIIHGNWAICGLISGLIAKVLGKKSIVTLRGTDTANLEKATSKIFVLACLKLSDAVVTVNHEMKERLVKKWPEFSGKITHIPNGIDPGFYQIQPVNSVNSCLKIISIGNLIPVKSVATVIKAVSVMNIPYCLHIIGDGSERVALEQLSRANQQEGYITFLGQQPPSTIPKLFEMHEVMVLASYREGRANVLLEAMAAGRIVIASDIPANRELIVNGHNGLLFPASDHEELARLLKRIKEQPNLAISLAKQAKETVIEMQLDWSNTAAAYSSLYTSLVTGEIA